MNTNTINDLYNSNLLTEEQVILVVLAEATGSTEMAQDILNRFKNRKAEGEKKSPVYRRWTLDEKAALKAMYENGVSRDEIASTLNISKQQVGGMIGAMRLLRPKAQSL